ncbi:MAG TPA: DUF1810 domain-containing protein [Myxococcaceae bacterium]|nr:DUF1810 domain-containing protein [Myxococcaceae bacterium]
MTGINDDLSRFIQAQANTYAPALAQLRAGRKTGHWMWFIFPQVAGLGRSAMSRQYAIRSANEARAYLDHPVLGARLRECTDALRSHAGKSIEVMLGSVDAMKLRSSMTLFAHVAGPGERFGTCLEEFFGGQPDAETLRLLGELDQLPLAIAPAAFKP